MNAVAQDELVYRVLGLAPQSKGDWVWRAVKLTFKIAARDIRVTAAQYLAERAWIKLKEDSYAQQVRMDREEFLRRASLNLANERRQRLSSTNTESKRKWQRFYNDLDYLININS